MLLECPSCATRYDLPAALPPNGRKVRCAKCGHVWVALPENLVNETLAPEPAMAAPEPAPPPIPEPPPPPPEPPVEEDADVVFMEDEPEPEPEPPAPERRPLMPSLPVMTRPPVTPSAEEAPVDAFMEDASMEEEPLPPLPEPEPIPEPEPEPVPEPEPIPEPEPMAALADEPPPEPFQEEEPAIPMAEWQAAAPETAAPEAGEPAQEDASFDVDEAADEDDDLPPMPPMSEPDAERMGIAMARRRSRSRAPVAIGWGVLALLLLAGLGGAYVMRADVVRALPGMAKVYAAVGVPVNIRNLEFEDVSYAWAVDDGRLILEVRGEVVNISDEPVRVPTVTFNLRNDADADIYQWAADIRTEPLAARDRTRFVARIPTPPKDVRSLQVRFADRG